MTPDTMKTEESIDTEVAQVRISGPGNRARTVEVPGNASLDEVKRRAYMVARHVAGYSHASVVAVNGYGVRLDGELADEPMPNCEAAE